MALNQSIIFKENTQSNVQPRKPTFEQYIVYGIPFRCSQDNASILTYISVYTFIYKQECNVLHYLLRECFKLDEMKFDIFRLKYIHIFAKSLSWYLDLRYFIELAVVAFRLILWIPEAMSFIKRIQKEEEVLFV